MTTIWPLLAAAGVVALADWWAVWNAGLSPRATLVERVAKPAVLLLLVAAAVMAPASGVAWGAAARPFLVAALICSLAGDVLLLPGGVFIGGLVAFLLGHVAYIAAFVQVPVAPEGLLGGSLVAGILAGIVGRLIVAAAGRSGLGVPVAAYLLVILAMAVLATGTLAPAAVLGAWLFVASDSMLGWGRFVSAPAAGAPAVAGAPADAGAPAVAGAPAEDRGDRRLNLAVIVTYHLGQALLLVALAG